MLRRERTQWLRHEHLRIFICMKRDSCQNISFHCVSAVEDWWDDITRCLWHEAVCEAPTKHLGVSGDARIWRNFLVIFRHRRNASYQIACALGWYIFKDCGLVFRNLRRIEMKFQPDSTVHLGVGRIEECGVNIFGCSVTWGETFTRTCFLQVRLHLKIAWMMSQDIKKAWGRLFTVLY